MNRIYIKYTSAKGNICSNLRIFNDIKGVSCKQVGETFYCTDADIMLEYFKNVVLKENDKVMNYGIYIDDKPIER